MEGIYKDICPPRHREKDDDNRYDFVAIDFETMTPYKTSACAIGMVRVIDGEIVQRFYSVINPVRDKYTDKEPTYTIHGISLETAEKSPTFKDLFVLIKGFIGNLPIVCHNSGADIPCIDRLMEYYGLEGIDTSNVFCTYAATRKPLDKCCEEFEIHLPEHHDALCDAEACAKIYLHLIGKPWTKKVSGKFESSSYIIDAGKKIKSEHMTQPDLDSVTRKDTVLFGAKVVITGVFDNFPDRDILASKIQELGAKINSGISRRTTHIIMGREPGPKKVLKYKELKTEGIDITIINETELLKILRH